ncbi:MAG: DUF4007 family protein [Elainellaceae cyanobacterium]
MVKQIDLNLGSIATKQPLVFARHETFHPRFGWLKKGFDRASQDSGVFLEDDATVRLGVGKNMVRSIRYWASAFKLLAEDQPTEFGVQLLGDSGWDPYLEDPASLWLLHWKLLEHTAESPCETTAWYVAFNYFRRAEFTFEGLFDELCDFRDRHSPRTANSSIKKDVSCLLRMYVRQPAKSLASEDSLDCPFTQLDLIHTAGDARHYTFRVGYKPNLPPEIVVYACLQHANRTVSGQTIPVAKLLYDIGSPGLAFRLTESALCDAIEQVERRYGQIRVSDAAGKLQVSFDAEAWVLADEILNRYYEAAWHGSND